MYDLLIHEATFARLEAALKAHAAELRPLVVNEGGISAGWGPALEGEPAPDLVYANADAFFGKAAPLFMRIAAMAPTLRWFQSGAAGIEHPVLRAIGRQAEVYTNSHAQSAAIAEWCLWQAFDWLRQGPERRADRAEKRWRRREAREMAGARWLIYGYGSIGQEVAKRVEALGGRVTGVRRRPGPAAFAEAVVSSDALSDALGKADIVLLAAPHTPETEGVADAGFFAAMAEGALFMNVGRGALVDEAALLEGLMAGRPGFAALDVFAEEPLPEASPFWSHPKVAMTPHDSPLTEATKHRVDQVFLGNLARFLKGEPLENIVPRAEFED